MRNVQYGAKTVGAMLREARLAAGLEYTDIAAQIKIKPAILAALENSEYDKLGSTVYMRGLLKNYARFLGLNSEQVLGLYRRETTELLTVRAKERHIKKFVLTGRSVSMIVGLVAVTLFGWYLLAQFMTLARPPQIRLTSPITLLASESLTSANHKTPEEQVVIAGSADENTLITINGMVTRVNAFNEFTSSALPLNIGENKIKIAVTNQFGIRSELLLTLTRTEPEIRLTSINGELLSRVTEVIEVYIDDLPRSLLQVNTGQSYSLLANQKLRVNSKNKLLGTIKISGRTYELNGLENVFEIRDGVLLFNNE